MKIKPIKRALLSVVSVALISGMLWWLSDGRPDAWIAVLAVIGVILTSGIWFLLAWQAYDSKLSEALPALLICLAPYMITFGLDMYMAPYAGNDGGNAWAWILDSYGNILFNPAYKLLSTLSEHSISTVSTTLFLLQILLPIALAYVIKFYEKTFVRRRR